VLVVLEQLHEESNSECSRHISSIPSKSHYLYTCKHLSGHTYIKGARVSHDVNIDMVESAKCYDGVVRIFVFLNTQTF